VQVLPADAVLEPRPKKRPVRVVYDLIKLF
jgi:hypothetical protein